jgi:hypothetical protein
MSFSIIIGGQPKRKTIPPKSVQVRYMTLEEVKALGYGSHPDFIANDGTLRTCKVNGAVKTWKRDSERIEVSVKYGLYEYATFDTVEALKRFVVRVSD